MFRKPKNNFKWNIQIKKSVLIYRFYCFNLLNMFCGKFDEQNEKENENNFQNLETLESKLFMTY